MDGWDQDLLSPTDTGRDRTNYLRQSCIILNIYNQKKQKKRNPIM